MVEDTELMSTVKDANGEDIEESQVKTLVQVPVGENVRLPGSDVRTGDLVLQKNYVITSLGGEIGTLAFVGRKEVRYSAMRPVKQRNDVRVGQGPTQTGRGPLEHRQRNLGSSIAKSTSQRRMGWDIRYQPPLVTGNATRNGIHGRRPRSDT